MRDSAYSRRSRDDVCFMFLHSHVQHHGRLKALVERGRADLLHGDLKALGAQDLQHALHAGLAEGAESPEIRPADGDALGRPCTKP